MRRSRHPPPPPAHLPHSARPCLPATRDARCPPCSGRRRRAPSIGDSHVAAERAWRAAHTRDRCPWLTREVGFPKDVCAFTRPPGRSSVCFMYTYFFPQDGGPRRKCASIGCCPAHQVSSPPVRCPCDDERPCPSPVLRPLCFGGNEALAVCVVRSASALMRSGIIMGLAGECMPSSNHCPR